MRKIQFQILIIAAVSLFLSACIFPTSSTTVSGRVTEYGKKPVAGAEVSFGGAGLETTTTTDADGTFTVTAQHRPTQMLNLTVSKPGVGTYSGKFPGFAAPSGDINVKLMGEIQTIPRTK